VYSTTDRGNTWQTQSATPWECDIKKMTKDTTIYVAGIYGTILKRNMREYRVNSLKTDSVTACIAYLSASLTSMLSTVDSSWLEYSTGGSTPVVVPASGPVQDTTIRIVKVLPNLMPDSTYSMRLKIYYNGAFYYSSPVSFKTIAIPASVISINGTVLISSDSLGNQWFLNTVPIAGANQSTFKPTMSGQYTVQRTVNGCTGPVSEPYNFVVTGVSDPVLAAAVSLFPNRVTSKLCLKNPQSKKLSLTILDAAGLHIKQFITSDRTAEVGLEAVPAGVYIVIITEVSSNKRIQLKMIKL